MTNRDAVLTDPLSEVTRKERRMLLGFSMLGVFVVHAGILPSKFSVLGVELTPSDQTALVYLMSLGLLYFITAFAIYAMSDFIMWKKIILKDHLLEYEKEMYERDRYPQGGHEEELDAEQRNVYKKNRIWFSLSKPVSIVRAFFEFMLPLLFGLYSTLALLFFASKN
ncbi:hypothetical protein [Rheinheimera faecalis]